MRLAPITVKTSVETAKRFLESSNNIVSYETIKDYLATYIDKAPKTYNSQVTDLRRFVRDFLGHEDLIRSFKMAPADEAQQPTELPTVFLFYHVFFSSCISDLSVSVAVISVK